MTFLRTVAVEDATGDVKTLYDQEIADEGFVSECSLAMTTRPEVLPAFETFLQQITQGRTLTPREYKLVTLIASAHTRSSFCGLMFGRALVADLGSPEAVERVVADYHAAGLSPREVAMLEYVEKISCAPNEITQADIDRLRAAGLSDENIFDVALATSFRHFRSRILCAVGADPDASLVESMPTPALRDALSFGNRR